MLSFVIEISSRYFVHAVYKLLRMLIIWKFPKSCGQGTRNRSTTCSGLIIRKAWKYKIYSNCIHTAIASSIQNLLSCLNTMAAAHLTTITILNMGVYRPSSVDRSLADSALHVQRAAESCFIRTLHHSKLASYWQDWRGFGEEPSCSQTRSR